MFVIFCPFSETFPGHRPILFRWHLSVCNYTYVIESLSFLHFDINEMKSIYKKLFKTKNPTLGSIEPVPVPATSTSTSTGTTDPIPSFLACDSDATASAQVNAAVSVSVQHRPSHL